MEKTILKIKELKEWYERRKIFYQSEQQRYCRLLEKYKSGTKMYDYANSQIQYYEGRITVYMIVIHDLNDILNYHANEITGLLNELKR